MRTVYARDVIGNITRTDAITAASFYGICCEASIRTFAMPGILGVRLDFRPATDKSSTITGCMFKSVFRIPEGSGIHRRYIDQSISIPSCAVEVFPLSRVNEATEATARDLCQNLIRNYEGVLHLARTSILDSLAMPIRDKAIAHVDESFGSATRHTAKNLLHSLNWPLLLEAAQVPEVFRNVVNYTLSNNHPQFEKMKSAGYRDPIDVLDNKYSRLQARLEDIEKSFYEEAVDQERAEQLAREYRQKKIELAKSNAKAMELLAIVCGKERADEYAQSGTLMVTKNGWNFVLSAGAWTRCSDPKGRTASLCIHTYGLSVNPIDEVTLQYMWIQNKFEDYMRTAIPHYQAEGFSLEEFRQSSK